MRRKFEGKGCEDCGEHHPKRGFYPIFEDDYEVTHRVCWDCFDRRCEADLARERSLRSSGEKGREAA